MNFESIRRAARGNGLTPANVIPDGSGGRMEEACIRLARITEGTTLQSIGVGVAEAWPGPLAYLDGVQQSQVIAYAGASPLVAAEIAAAVRERHDRRLKTVVEVRRRLALGRRAALDAAGNAVAGMSTVTLPEDEPPHPIRDLVNASRALDRARGELEIE